MIVATVYKRGSPEYGLTWVHSLKRQLNRAMGGQYRAPFADPEPGTWTFRCLSDDPGLGNERIALEHMWPGWWSKLELFRPGLWPAGELVVALDLDTLVCGDLTVFEHYTGRFAMVDDFYRPRLAQSGVMLLRDVGSDTWAKWMADPREHMAANRGDGEWLAKSTTHERIQRAFPGMVVSYKVHALEGPPPGARLVCGHGRPRFSEPSTGWAHEQWGAL